MFLGSLGRNAGTGRIVVVREEEKPEAARWRSFKKGRSRLPPSKSCVANLTGTLSSQTSSGDSFNHPCIHFHPSLVHRLVYPAPLIPPSHLILSPKPRPRSQRCSYYILEHAAIFAWPHIGAKTVRPPDDVISICASLLSSAVLKGLSQCVSGATDM